MEVVLGEIQVGWKSFQGLAEPPVFSLGKGGSTRTCFGVTEVRATRFLGN